MKYNLRDWFHYYLTEKKDAENAVVHTIYSAFPAGITNNRQQEIILIHNHRCRKDVCQLFWHKIYKHNSGTRGTAVNYTLNRGCRLTQTSKGIAVILFWPKTVIQAYPSEANTFTKQKQNRYASIWLSPVTLECIKDGCASLCHDQCVLQLFQPKKHFYWIMNHNCTQYTVKIRLLSLRGCQFVVDINMKY